LKNIKNDLAQKDLVKSLEANYKEKLKEKDLKLEKLSAIVEISSQENKEIQRLYENTKSNLEKLEQETKKSKKTETPEDTKDELQDFKDLKKEFNKVNQELGSKNSELESLNHSVKNLKTQLENSEVLISDLNSKNQSYKNSIDQASDRWENEKKDLVNDIKNLKNGEDYFDKQKLRIAQLEEDLETEIGLKGEQNQQIKSLEGEIENLNNKLEEIEKKPKLESDEESGNTSQNLKKQITDLKDAFKMSNETYVLLELAGKDSSDEESAKKIVQKSIESNKQIIAELQNAAEKDPFLLKLYTDDILKKNEIVKKLTNKNKSSGKSEKNENSVNIFNKKVVHAGHHGGAWKVAYADFVTAMMAFFLLMWLLSQLSENAKDNLVEYFKNYKVFSHTGQAAPKFHQENFKSDSQDNYLTEHQEVSQTEKNKDNKAEIIKEFKERYKGSDEHLSVELLAGGIRIQIMDLYDKNMFETGSAKLTPESMEVLQFVAERIKTIPGSLIIEGHTDGFKFKGDKYTNWELSMDRAASARYELIKNGVLPNRIKRIVAYGSSEPAIKDNYMAPKNRRINIIIINENNN
jgi:chemotaxis protein MotB